MIIIPRLTVKSLIFRKSKLLKIFELLNKGEAGANTNNLMVAEILPQAIIMLLGKWLIVL